MSTIRFFTGLMLRPDDEIDAAIVPWLDRWATVEFAGDDPVTGVWQTRAGERRVCWYGVGTAADWRDAHRERYGDEPFWIIQRDVDADGDLGALIQECDERCELVVRRNWRFNGKGIPATEEELGPDGVLIASRKYAGCGRTADFVRERRPPWLEETRPFLPRPPVPELSGETFPGGGTLSDGAVRVLSPILENELQGRYRSICWRDGGWRPAITTLAFVRSKGIEKARPILDLEGEQIAPLVAQGDLNHPRWPSWETPYSGIAELVPDGSTVEDIVESSLIDVPDAVRIVLRVGEVACRPQEQGHGLGGGIRPELVYLRRTAMGLEVSGLLHRAPAFLGATRRGEAILFPSNTFPCDFSHSDDVTGLAQLLWYMLTGSHPFLAQEDIRWNESWNSFRHQNRRRQAWRGPSALLPLLERTLFQEGSETPPLAEFLGDLRLLHERLMLARR